MENILLPTDFSDNSRHAIDYALKYFSGMKCHFIVLNVQKSSDFIMDDLMTSKPGSSVHQAIAGDNKEQLNSLVDSLRESSSHEEFEFEPVFDFDVFVDSVKQIVESRSISLIVMGTNGASGAAESIFGSNTLKVIRNVDCPLLAIPENYQFGALNRLLFTVLDDHYPSIEELEPLMVLVGKYQPEIQLLHINQLQRPEDDLNSEEKMKALFEGKSCTYYDVDGIPAPMAINMFVQLHHIDMHAMLIQKKSFLDRFIHGSHTSRISYSSEVPLLVLNR